MVSKHRESVYRAGCYDRWIKVKNRQFRRSAGCGINFSEVLSRIAQLDQRTAPPGPMSALGGSGRAAPKEEVRV